MHVLVTGGLGFLGHAVTADLTDAGHRVTILTRGRPSTSVPRGVGLVTGDVRDRSRMAEVIASTVYDGVVHLAAVTSGRDSFADPLTYFDVNTGGTLNLLLALDAVRRDRPPARFVFASTNIVYGSIHVGALSEDLEPHPESPYASSKLAAEQLVGAYAATGAIGAITLRPFNIAGAAAGVTDTDRTRIIPNIFRVLTGELPHVTLNGDGTAVRDFVHVADVASAARLALEAADPGNYAVYNVGSGTGSTMTNIVRAVEAALDVTVNVQRNPPRPEPLCLTADATRAQRELGWIPSKSDPCRMITDAWHTWQASNGIDTENPSPSGNSTR